jgi:hypothetical protein
MKAGGARIKGEWGYDLHEIVLTPRNRSMDQTMRQVQDQITRLRGRGAQWEYWVAGGFDGDLSVEYGEGGVGFDGKLSDAMIEEAE